MSLVLPHFITQHLGFGFLSESSDLGHMKVIQSSTPISFIQILKSNAYYPTLSLFGRDIRFRRRGHVHPYFIIKHLGFLFLWKSIFFILDKLGHEGLQTPIRFVMKSKNLSLIKGEAHSFFVGCNSLSNFQGFYQKRIQNICRKF